MAHRVEFLLIVCRPSYCLFPRNNGAPSSAIGKKRRRRQQGSRADVVQSDGIPSPDAATSIVIESGSCPSRSLGIYGPVLFTDEAARLAAALSPRSSPQNINCCSAAGYMFLSRGRTQRGRWWASTFKSFVGVRDPFSGNSSFRHVKETRADDEQ